MTNKKESFEHYLNSIAPELRHNDHILRPIESELSLYLRFRTDMKENQPCLCYQNKEGFWVTTVYNSNSNPTAVGLFCSKYYRRGFDSNFTIKSSMNYRFTQYNLLVLD